MLYYILPLSNNQFLRALQNSTDYQISFANCCGRIGKHYPAGRLWNFLILTEFVITEIVQPPIVQKDTFYDDLSNGRVGVRGPYIHQTTNISPSAQQVLLAILIHLLQLIHKLLNIISDSTYVEVLFPAVDSYLCTL